MELLEQLPTTLEVVQLEPVLDQLDQKEELEILSAVGAWLLSLQLLVHAHQHLLGLLDVFVLRMLLLFVELEGVNLKIGANFLVISDDLRGLRISLDC